MKITLLIILAFFLLLTTARSENAESVKSSYEHKVIGVATYYTKESCQREGTSGILMASNKPYVESAMTCALPFHPPIKNNRRQWGQEYKITCLVSGKCIKVKHMDYGPGKKAQARGVIIDLTPAAFKKLCPLRKGRVKVRVERVR